VCRVLTVFIILNDNDLPPNDLPPTIGARRLLPAMKLQN
jgi:hypothetical protein